jgi:hypothetical protein
MNMMAEYMTPGSIEREAWGSVVEMFRRACSLYHGGHREEALEMVSGELPQLVNRWSDSSPLAPLEKRRRLIEMFMSEGRRLGESALVERILFAHMRERDRMECNVRSVLTGGGLHGSITLVEESGSGLQQAPTRKEAGGLVLNVAMGI